MVRKSDAINQGTCAWLQICSLHLFFRLQSLKKIHTKKKIYVKFKLIVACDLKAVFPANRG
jgi:hypothetical protein